MGFDRDLFLPVSREDMDRRGWDSYDVLLITGDAYVDRSAMSAELSKLRRAGVLDCKGRDVTLHKSIS